MKPRVPISLVFKVAALTSAPILGVMVAALLVVNHRLTVDVNRNVTASLSAAALAFEEQMGREGENLERIGVVIARDPKFFALLTLPKSDRKNADFHATLAGVLSDFRDDAETPVFDVTDADGRLLARAGDATTQGEDLSRTVMVREALAGRNSRGYLVERGVAYRIAVVPITVGGSLVGTLRLGRSIDSSLAERLKATARSEVVFVVDGKPLIATTRGADLPAGILAGAQDGSVQQIDALGHRYLALREALGGPSAGGTIGFVLLRSLDEETIVLTRIGHDLYITGAIVIVLALLVGALVSAGITRPIRRLVDAANAMRVGDFDFPLQIRSRDELGNLASRFEEMRAAQRLEIERLEEIDRMKSNFITIASHEILTPVTTIVAFTDLLRDGALGSVNDPQREAFSAIRRGADSLTRLAKDLTNMTLIERGELPLRFEPRDVARVAEEIAVQVIPLAAQRQQDVAILIEPELQHSRIDAGYLGQAIMNLALNAVRFTPDGGSIEIGARRAERGVEVYVSDTGIGISREDFDKIFSKMVELKDVNSHSSGTIGFNSSGFGLGLSIARGIVEAHGGTIRVESELGRGSLFTIELPYPVAAASTDSESETLPLAS
ncbi:MAG TPA: ATP-binding protein [Candidatus Eisenbacteria bacterium]|nr:ATP-binding protein [Candidatus Eisenbacteria bacterium]